MSKKIDWEYVGIGLIRLGDHLISKEKLYRQIIDRIPKNLFSKIVLSIQKDLDNEKKSPKRT